MYVLYSLYLCQQKLGDPIQERCWEAQERPAAFEDLGRALQHYRKFLDLYANKVRFVRHEMSCWLNVAVIQ